MKMKQKQTSAELVNFMKKAVNYRNYLILFYNKPMTTSFNFVVKYYHDFDQHLFPKSFIYFILL